MNVGLMVWFRGSHLVHSYTATVLESYENSMVFYSYYAIFLLVPHSNDQAAPDLTRKLGISGCTVSCGLGSLGLR